MLSPKFRFKFTKRHTAKAVLREVKNILSDPRNFTQHQQQRYKDGQIDRVCTLVAIRAVAASDVVTNKAISLLEASLKETAGCRSIVQVNNGFATESGPGQKNRSRELILAGIDKALA